MTQSERDKFGAAVSDGINTALKEAFAQLSDRTGGDQIIPSEGSLENRGQAQSDCSDCSVEDLSQWERLRSVVQAAIIALFGSERRMAREWTRAISRGEPAVFIEHPWTSQLPKELKRWQEIPAVPDSSDSTEKLSQTEVDGTNVDNEQHDGKKDISRFFDNDGEPQALVFIVRYNGKSETEKTEDGPTSDTPEQKKENKTETNTDASSSEEDNTFVELLEFAVPIGDGTTFRSDVQELVRYYGETELLTEVEKQQQRREIERSNKEKQKEQKKEIAEDRREWMRETDLARMIMANEIQERFSTHDVTAQSFAQKYLLQGIGDYYRKMATSSTPFLTNPPMIDSEVATPDSVSPRRLADMIRFIARRIEKDLTLSRAHAGTLPKIARKFKLRRVSRSHPAEGWAFSTGGVPMPGAIETAHLALEELAQRYNMEKMARIGMTIGTIKKENAKIRDHSVSRPVSSSSPVTSSSRSADSNRDSNHIETEAFRTIKDHDIDTLIQTVETQYAQWLRNDHTGVRATIQRMSGDEDTIPPLERRLAIVLRDAAGAVIDVVDTTVGALESSVRDVALRIGTRELTPNDEQHIAQSISEEYDERGESSRHSISDKLSLKEAMEHTMQELERAPGFEAAMTAAENHARRIYTRISEHYGDPLEQDEAKKLFGRAIHALAESLVLHSDTVLPPTAVIRENPLLREKIINVLRKRLRDYVLTV